MLLLSSIDLERQSEHSGLRPDTRILVNLIVNTLCISDRTDSEYVEPYSTSLLFLCYDINKTARTRAKP